MTVLIRRTYLEAIALTIAGLYLGAYLTQATVIPYPHQVLFDAYYLLPDLYPGLIKTFSIATIAMAATVACSVVVLCISSLLSLQLKVLRYLLLILYICPIAMIGPIVAAIAPPLVSAYVMALFTIFYPVFLFLQLNLRDLELRRSAFGTVYGRTNWLKLRHLIAPPLVPLSLMALRFSFPWATLGVMLGEYLGSSSGLGVFLLGTISRSDVGRLWAVCLVILIVVGSISSAMTFLINHFSSTFDETESTEDALLLPEHFSLTAICAGLLTIAVFWQVLASLAFPGSTIFLGPLALVARMSRSTAMLSPILGPLSETLRSSALGLCLAIVLGAIWGLASPLSRTKIWFDFILMPFQALPIIAGVQVIGLAFGRGYVATVVIVILATIYPIYRGVSDHLAQAPSNLARYSTLYDIPRVRQLWFIYRNWVILGMLRGVRSAAPRAILGATVAETFLSGGGLGWLVYHARGTLDFTQVWLILTAVLLISLLTDVLMSFVEMIVSAKFRM